MAVSEATTCLSCGGDGYNDDGSICLVCAGGGSTPVTGQILYVKTRYDILDENFAELKAWCITVNQKLAYLKEKIDAL